MASLTIRKRAGLRCISADSRLALAESMGFVEQKGKAFAFEANGGRLAAASRRKRRKSVSCGPSGGLARLAADDEAAGGVRFETLYKKQWVSKRAMRARNERRV
jgi:hypothetical protein